MLHFVQNTDNSHYMRVNFMNLDPNYETYDKDALSDPVVFPIVQANW
jgi:hypothetical protein